MNEKDLKARTKQFALRVMNDELTAIFTTAVRSAKKGKS